jgi:hypothetical protein
MPKISKKLLDEQELWLNKIARAKKVRASWRDLFKIELAREYLDGKQNPGYDVEDWITINNLYIYLKSQLPALYSANPYFYVKLKRSYSPDPKLIDAWEKRGKMRGAMLNYLKDELNFKQKSRLAIQDGQTSYGVVKVHHSSDMQDNENAGKPIIADDKETILKDDNGVVLVQPDQIPINSRYNITRIHPDDYVWDEDAGTLEDDWNWVAQCIRQPLEEMRNDPRFDKRALKSLEGKSEVQDDENRAREDRKKGGDIQGRSEVLTSEQGKKKIKEPDIIARWEIYHIKKGTWRVIAEGASLPLMEEQPLPPGIEKHPFAILRFTLRDDSPYPIPPFSQGLDLCKEYNRARSDIQKHRKRFNRKYEANESAFEEPDTELSKLESGDDGTVLKKRTGEQAILPVSDAQLDPLRYNELSFLKAEMNQLFGLDTGETQQIAKADSATQAGILDRRLEVKEGDAMSIVMDFVTEIARKLDMLVQVHITQDEAVKITGPEGDLWELVRMEDYDAIEGEYEYSVNPGATIPNMPHVERASWMAFLGILASFPHLLLSRRLFKKMAEMHHIEDEVMLEELYNIGQKIMGGQLPMPGQSGSQAGVGEDRPVSAMGGQAGGIQSTTKGNAAIGA